MPKTNYYIPQSQLVEEKLIRWIKLHVRQKDVAEFLGCSPSNISHKLNHGSLTATDLIAIFHLAEAEPTEVGKLLTY